MRGLLLTAVASGSVALAACSGTGGDIESIAKGATKTAGGENGDGDYCNDPGNRCLDGEGDCDRNAHCQPGLTCGKDNGALFGLAPQIDVCVSDHCQNGFRDADEDDVDCGGVDCAPCGACGARAGVANGDPDGYCTDLCPCGVGEGDCDGKFQCAPGLLCGVDNGAAFGMPPAFDVCFDRCSDGQQNGDEEGVDCGGSCAPCGCLSRGIEAPHPDFCTADCPCGDGEGDCDRAADCAPGLTCINDIGASFGYPPGVDVCIDACGDSVCQPGETPLTCPNDCRVCGDSICGTAAGENDTNCPQDCGAPAIWDQSNWDQAVWQ